MTTNATRKLIRHYTDMTAMLLYGLGQAGAFILWFFVAVLLTTAYGLPFQSWYIILGGAGFMGTYFYSLRKYEKVIRDREAKR